ncbi:MAG: sigma factor, partial [Rhodococcus sp. (in: high G+C Gram-positive bacteria)]|uniref:sigma factor n=1 Tax=Rhodococcus sp. TaxID=1831 RepID=UPI003D9B4AD1
MDVARVFRAEHGRAVAAVTRFTGDLTLAEDAVQDAFVDALRAWPDQGEPANPGAWITTVARRRALDRIRREAARDGKEVAAVRCGDVL